MAAVKVPETPRQELELAIGEGRRAADLSPECIRAIRNALPFDEKCSLAVGTTGSSHPPREVL